MSRWTILAALMAVGPIYWFGSLGYTELKIIKAFLLAVFLLFFIADFIKSKRRFELPRSFVVLPLLVIPSVIIAAGYKSAGLLVVLDELFDYLLAFALVYLVYNASFLYEDFEGVCSRVALLVPIVSCLIITNYFFGLPAWRGPYYDISFDIAGLHYTGFGSTRTQWSVGVALLYPLILIGGFDYLKKHKLILLSVMLLIFMSVFIPGGRGGIIAVLLISYFALLLFFSRNIFSASIVLSMVGGGLLLVMVLGSENRAVRALSTAGDLNELSSGRVEGINTGIEIFSENPLVGIGLGNVDLREFGHDVPSIHNYWVGAAAESGVFMPLAVLIMFLLVFCEYYKNRKYLPAKYKASFYVLVVGLFMSNLEPTGFIGNFQQQTVFWVCLGRLLYVLRYKLVTPQANGIL